MIDHAVRDLGYERIEWRANVLYEHCVRAAERLGFRFEGLLRRHAVVRGIWRDTWWGSILAEEWNGNDMQVSEDDREFEGSGERRSKKGLRRAMQEWLDDSNFDENGCQRRRLESFRD